MNKKNETIDAEVIEEKGIILSPFKDLDLTEGVDLKKLMKTYSKVPDIDPEAENAGEQYQYVLKGHKAFVRARNTIEKVRKALKAPALKFGKDVDSRAKELAYGISAKETELFKQRKLVEDNEQRKQDEAERVERERTDSIRTLITSIQNMAMQGIGLKSSTLKDLIGSLEIPSKEVYEEFLDEAMGYYKTTMTQLETLFETAVKAEEAGKFQEEIEAEKAEADRIVQEEIRAEREEFEREKREFEAEKREMAEAKALKLAEDEAEEQERSEVIQAKLDVEEAVSRLELTKEAIANSVYQAYADGGVDAILDKLFENEIPHVRWEV